MRRMQEKATDAVKAQARQAIKVLRKQAQKAGLSQEDTAALTPAQLLRLGRPPAMSTKQKDALKAAYAVGAARRAAKLAWMKVIRKVDRPTSQRQRMMTPNAPSVAADTAMKALVAALKQPAKKQRKLALIATQSSFPVKSDGNAAPQDSLKLPRDKYWAKLRGTQHDSSNTKQGEHSQQVEKDVEIRSGPSRPTQAPMSFGAELEQMTTQEAQKEAQELTRVAEKRVADAKMKEARRVRKMERKAAQITASIKKKEKVVLQRQKRALNSNVEVMQENLALAEKRRNIQMNINKREFQRQANTEIQLVNQLMQHSKTDEADKVKHAKQEQTNIQKDLRAVLEEGKKTHNAAWAAKLFRPRTRVISDSQYKVEQAKKKRQRTKRKADEKAAQLKLVALEQKRKQHRESKRKAQRTQHKQALKTKVAQVKAAMQQVQDAKKLLAKAVKSKPEDAGLEEYLSTPATPDDVSV